jgi:hypothetical protein
MVPLFETAHELRGETSHVSHNSHLHNSQTNEVNSVIVSILRFSFLCIMYSLLKRLYTVRKNAALMVDIRPS